MSDHIAMEIQAGHEAKAGFGEQALVRAAETTAMALAEQAKAAVNARYIMAMQRPRDLMCARQALLADCKRPAFADAAIYRKPVGEGVEGPSIRMAEAAARAMGNILADACVIYDDAQKRIVRVSATDLEANVTYPLDVTIAKTIERNRPMPGRKVIGTRKNSKGGDVYIIEATDEEILDKERATTSKAMRTCLLRLIPGDILEEAIELCYATRRSEIKRDPTAALKKMVDSFELLGVTAAQLADYFGHALSNVTAKEIEGARGIYQSLKDKYTTWSEVMDAKRVTTEPAGTEPTGSLGDKLADKAAKVAPKPVDVKPATEVKAAS